VIPTESLPSSVKKLRRASKDLGVMATQTDTKANIGMITLGCQSSGSSKNYHCPPFQQEGGPVRNFVGLTEPKSGLRKA